VAMSTSTSTYNWGDGAVTTRKKSQARPRPQIEERGPRLGWLATMSAWVTRHVSTKRSRRHRETQLQPKFRRDALRTPRAVGAAHIGDQALEIDGDRRPAAAP
jgi:hypothetical protein